MNAAYASVLVQNLKVTLLDQKRGAAPASMLDCAAHMLLCFDEPEAMYSAALRFMLERFRASRVDFGFGSPDKPVYIPNAVETVARSFDTAVRRRISQPDMAGPAGLAVARAGLSEVSRSSSRHRQSTGRDLARNPNWRDVWRLATRFSVSFASTIPTQCEPGTRPTSSYFDQFITNFSARSSEPRSGSKGPPSSAQLTDSGNLRGATCRMRLDLQGSRAAAGQVAEHGRQSAPQRARQAQRAQSGGIGPSLPEMALDVVAARKAGRPR